MCSLILSVHFTNSVRWHTPKYLKPNLHSANFLVTFQGKGSNFLTSNLASSLVQLQPLNLDQMVTCQHFTLDVEALLVTSTCALIFHVLSAPCLKNVSSAVPSHLLFFTSLSSSCLFSPHLIVKEQKCRYSSTG